MHKEELIGEIQRLSNEALKIGEWRAAIVLDILVGSMKLNRIVELELVRICTEFAKYISKEMRNPK